MTLILSLGSARSPSPGLAAWRRAALPPRSRWSSGRGWQPFPPARSGRVRRPSAISAPAADRSVSRSASGSS